LADAVKRVQADDPLPMKEFTFVTQTRHIRNVPGDRLPEYMLLPVESYTLYDARLMRRIGEDIFELSLPVEAPPGAPASLAVSPTLRVRVTPDANASTLQIQSIGASLYGLDGDASSDTGSPAPLAALPSVTTSAGAANQSAAAHPAATRDTNATAEATRTLGRLERVLRSANLSFATTLSWQSVTPRGNISTRLTTQATVRLAVELPPPFTLSPRLLVQGAVGVIMRSVADLVLPHFVNLLEMDYNRWLNGTARDSAIGALMPPPPATEAASEGLGPVVGQ